MDSNIAPQPNPAVARPRTGLAVACLVLGILAVFSSVLLVGALLGLLAILLGLIHLSKRRGPNGMAWTGILLSLLSILLSVGSGVLYLKGFRAIHKEWNQQANAKTVEAVEPGFAKWIGEAVPEFTVTSLEGETFRSTELRGRRVVLDFWATWCPPCRQEIPHFMQLSDENSREELVIIGISSEDKDTLREFVDKEGMNYPVVSADDLPAPFDTIDAIPTTFFIDRNGRIQSVVVGYHDYERLKELALADDLPPIEDAVADEHR